MQIRWKITSALLNVAHLLWFMTTINRVCSDKTACRSSIETGEGLHFICFCDASSSEVSDPVAETKTHLSVNLLPDSNGKNDFSLAKFAYNLSGAYFRKKIHLTFQYCRHLTIILDQNELNRIGSEYFRPDIQVSSCFIEHVYHLEIIRGINDILLDKGKRKGSLFPRLNAIEEYAPSVDKTQLDLTVYSSSNSAKTTATLIYIRFNR